MLYLRAEISFRVTKIFWISGDGFATLCVYEDYGYVYFLTVNCMVWIISQAKNILKDNNILD